MPWPLCTPRLPSLLLRCPSTSLQRSPLPQFTVNPRTGRVDYILATSPDLAAVELVAGGLLRRDSRGNEVQGALPVYITQEHFER